jgi:hypothetical protein
MADRNRAAAATGAIRSRTTAPGGVRRNLFQSQLTRRPTPTSSNSTETLRLDIDVLSDTSEIVVRDKHGEVELGDLPTPVFDEPDDATMEEKQENESESFTSVYLLPVGHQLTSPPEERQRLADAVVHHRNQNTVPDQPEGLSH